MVTATRALVAFRTDVALVERLERVASRLRRPGLAITRTDALRVAVVAGLDALEREEAGAASSK